MSPAKKSKRTFSYQALSYSQRGPTASPSFLIFHAAAADIIEWADVDRLEPGTRTGAQRPLRQIKVSKVANFFARNSRNTIPTAVVIALDQRSVKFVGQPALQGFGKHGVVTITMSNQNKPGLIIDGQHRAFGTAKFSADVHLNVVAFLGGDDAERAFQFVVINNSATRVNKDHIKALNLNFDKEKLNNRLIASAGLALALGDKKYDDLQAIDGSQPFKGLLNWPTNPNGFIPPSAVESALAETRDRAALLGIEDLETEVFLAIWLKIREIRPKVWEAFPKSRLLLKVSIYALTVYVLESMVAKQRNEDTPIDFTTEDTLNGLVERVILRIPEEFWTADWKVTELDTGLGRQTLLEALQIIDSNVRFSRPWYDKVPLIDPAMLKERSKKHSPSRKSGTKGKHK
jgi:DGQHR domain-containing protein